MTLLAGEKKVVAESRVVDFFEGWGDLVRADMRNPRGEEFGVLRFIYRKTGPSAVEHLDSRVEILYWEDMDRAWEVEAECTWDRFQGGRCYTGFSVGVGGDQAVTTWEGWGTAPYPGVG